MKDALSRRTVRLQNINYNESGAYFVTICTHNRKMLFGTVENGTMIKNRFGVIAEEEIIKTNSLRYASGIQISKFVVMPNHVHMLIEIKKCVQNDISSVGTQCTVSAEKFKQYQVLPEQSVPVIVRAYKAAVTKCIRQNTARSENPNGAVALRENFRNAPAILRMQTVCFFLFSFSEEKRKRKKGTFSDVLGVSSSAELDEGLCPFDPCKPLKRLERNFYTCDNLLHKA